MALPRSSGSSENFKINGDPKRNPIKPEQGEPSGVSVPPLFFLLNSLKEKAAMSVGITTLVIISICCSLAVASLFAEDLYSLWLRAPMHLPGVVATHSSALWAEPYTWFVAS